MNIVFMGTPDFALPSLRILLEHDYEISAVVTAPDKPRGRGREVSYTPVKEFALRSSLRVLQPESLNDAAFVSHLNSLRPELIVVVAFRILPPEVFTIPSKGSFNLHASLLPRYRGAAPIQWAIIKGEKETGVTTFFLQEKVDTGNILLQARVAITESMTAGELHDILADVGAEIVLQTVRLIELDRIRPRPQDDTMATPAPKITRESCRIHWDAPAKEVHDFIRGLSPSPAAWTSHQERQLKIYRSRLSDLNVAHRPGTAIIRGRNLFVATAGAPIEILEIQQEGKKRMDAEEFLRGYHFSDGEIFR